MPGKEDRLNPEVLTIKEKLYNETDKRWYAKIDTIRSEAGAFKSAAVGTGSLSSNITKTDLLTATLSGTLASAGMKFLLKEVVVSGPKAGDCYLWDGTLCTAASGKCRLRVTLTTQSVAGGRNNVQYTDIHGCRFSSAVRYKVTTAMAIHVGGLRLVLQV